MSSPKRKPFVCPNCGQSIKSSTAFFLNNFSVVSCSNCHTELVPDLRETSKIGLISGAIGGLLGFSITIILSTYGFPILGIGIALVIFAAVYLITVSTTRKKVTFKIR